ncbi:MAG: alpha/beta hydrolase [Nitriliruptor sp.]|nr:MAG: alpha/beta hydrolase [Nitriliruptor sp.]
MGSGPRGGLPSNGAPSASPNASPSRQPAASGAPMGGGRFRTAPVVACHEGATHVGEATTVTDAGGTRHRGDVSDCRERRPGLSSRPTGGGDAVVAWQRRVTRVGQVGLHLARGGPAGAPAIVALHGIGDDGECWRPVADDLASDHDVVLLDARGHGRSDAPVAGYTTREHVADVAGVLAALDLHRPLLLGHSMGAVTALALAALHPGLPGRIALEDPPPWWSRPSTPNEVELARTRSLQATILALKRRTHGELLEIQREAAPRWSNAALERWADSTQRLSAHVPLALEEQHRSNSGLQWPSLLARVRCPALLLHGDTDRGGALDAAAARSLQVHVPHVEVAHLPGAGHMPRHEDPRGYLAAVRGFLATT